VAEKTPTEQKYTSADFANWLNENESLRGTEQYLAVQRSYDASLSLENMTPSTQTPPVPTEEMGIFEAIQEGFTGERRATELTETLPSYQRMPEFDRIFSLPVFKTAVGTIMGDQQEMAQVIKAQFPDVEVRTDERGNPILRSAIDGREYAIPPGMDFSDIPRAGAAAALFALTKGRGFLGTAAQGAGTQAVYEAAQTGLGGEFDTADVAFAGIVPATFYTLGSSFRALQPYFQNVYARFFDTNKTPASKIVNPNLTVEETADLATRAAGGDSAAARLLAEDAAPDANTIAAARRLGIEQNLQPDHVTTSQVYRELAQLAKSQSGSATRAAEIQGLQSVGERAFQLIDELGGTADLSTLNAGVRNNMKNTLGQLDTQVKNSWDTLREAVRPTTPVSAENVLNLLNTKISEGVPVEAFSPLEKQILKFLSPVEKTGKIGNDTISLGVTQPTYSLLDLMRRKAGNATRFTGEFGATEDIGRASQLYKAMVADIKAAAESVGPDAVGLYENAVAVTKLQKAMQDDLVALFGKNVDTSMVSSVNNALIQLSRGDADSIVRLLQAVPSELRSRVAVSGITSAFGKATQNGQLNFNTYTKWYEGLLRNRAAYRTLMSYLPEGSMKQFSDLYRVSRGVQMATREYSRTGKALQEGMRTADTALSRLYGVAQRAAIGVPVEAVASSLGFPGMGVGAGVTSAVINRGQKPAVIKAVDDMIGSPQFLQMVREAGTAQEVEAARRLAGTSAFRRFADAIDLPLSDRQNYILSIFQSGGQSFMATPDEAPAVEEEVEVTIPPQARVAPPAPQTRGVPGMGAGTAAPAPEAAAPTGPVSPSSREMLQQLFPTDFIA